MNWILDALLWLAVLWAIGYVLYRIVTAIVEGIMGGGE